MKHSVAVLVLLVLVFACGCGGGVRSSRPRASPSSGSQAIDVTGNWQFSMSSSVSGAPHVTIGGSISRSGNTVSGAAHVNGSNCFDQLTTIDVTGTLSGGSFSLTSESVSGQVIGISASITASALSGTYSITGGCANGSQGSVTGVKIPYIANTLNGTFIASGRQPFDLTGSIAQDATPNSAGSYDITGTATFNGSCLSSGVVIPGNFPSGSFIIGTSVGLQIDTGNGTLAFLGVLEQSTGTITGNYHINGGTCDQTGTAVLAVSSPWDY